MMATFRLSGMPRNCSSYSGAKTEEKHALLNRVLWSLEAGEIEPHLILQTI